MNELSVLQTQLTRGRECLRAAFLLAREITRQAVHHTTHDHYATREAKGKQSSSVIDRWTLVDLLALPFAALIRDTPWNVREIGTCSSKIKFNKSYFVQHIKRDSQRKWKAVHEKLFCCCFLRLLQAFSKNQFFISIFLQCCWFDWLFTVYRCTSIDPKWKFDTSFEENGSSNLF